MAILIISEHDNQELKSETLNAVSAGMDISHDLHILVAGHRCESVLTKARSIEGVTRVLFADDLRYSDQLAENMASLIANISHSYTHIIAPSTSSINNFLPRAAAILDTSMISDVIDIVSCDIFKKHVYSGSALATIKFSEQTKILTIRSTVYKPAKITNQQAPVEYIAVECAFTKTSVTETELFDNARPELSSARIVVGGGRGLSDQKNFSLIEALADKIGAAVGVTRAIVDLGYAGNELLIGQTGQFIAPDVYIAVGISGAIQHTSGIKDSKIIVAINQDPDAPILQVSNYALIADYKEVLPELIDKV